MLDITTRTFHWVTPKRNCLMNNNSLPISAQEYNKSIMGFLNLSSGINYNESGLSPTAIRTIGQLNGFCSMLAQSAMQLIWSGCVWEAEIIIRTILEASIRLAYICIDKSEVEDKVFEYNEVLANVYQTKREKRMDAYLKNVNSDDPVLKKSFEEVIAIHPSSDMNRKRRQQIERKWAFNELTTKIDSYGLDYLNKMTYFANSYGTASHIVHADSDGVGMIWERDSRSNDEKEAITYGHIARELSDIFWLSVMRTYVISKLFNIPVDRLTEYIKMQDPLLNKIKQLEKIWADYYKENYGTD